MQHKTLRLDYIVVKNHHMQTTVWFDAPHTPWGWGGGGTPQFLFIRDVKDTAYVKKHHDLV